MTHEDMFWDNEWKNGDGSLADTISHFMQLDAMRDAYANLRPVMVDGERRTVLDLGCGSGATSATLYETYGLNVVAVDISKESVTLAQTRADKIRRDGQRIGVLEMNAEQLDFPDETFDFVFINCMLMHTDYEKVLNESKRVLKKGGRIVLKEVLRTWLFRFPYRTFSPFRHSKPNYITLEDLDRHGFTHEEYYLLSSGALGLYFINKTLGDMVCGLLGAIERKLFKGKLGEYAWVTIGV